MGEHKSPIFVVESDGEKLTRRWPRDFVWKTERQSDLVRFLVAVDKAGGCILHVVHGTGMTTGDVFVIYRHTDEIEIEEYC